MWIKTNRFCVKYFHARNLGRITVFYSVNLNFTAAEKFSYAIVLNTLNKIRFYFTKKQKTMGVDGLIRLNLLDHLLPGGNKRSYILKQTCSF